MTTISSSLRRAAILAPALAATGATGAQAAPHNPAPGAQVRIERINGANAMTVAAPKQSVGLRVDIPAPADGTTEASVRVVRDGKRLHDDKLPLEIKDGRATLKKGVSATKVGTYRVGVRVNGRVVGKVVEFDVLPSRVTSGAKGRSVRMMQAVLKRRAYVVGAAGTVDGRTQRALVAVRKRLGLSRTATFDRTLANRLARGEGGWTVKFKDHGRHVEADLSLQLIALIGSNGKAERIYTTSSGKPSTPTVLGSYSVYRKDLGTNAKGMVDSSYFIRGYAIHGYAEVPTYNASHGCLRVPVPDALSIFRWVRYGTKVDVYR